VCLLYCLDQPLHDTLTAMSTVRHSDMFRRTYIIFSESLVTHATGTKPITLIKSNCCYSLLV